MKIAALALPFLLILSSCEEKKEEEIIDLEKMAVYEEEEAFSPVEERSLITEYVPEPQERVIEERVR